MPQLSAEVVWLAVAVVAAGVVSGFLAGVFGIGGGAIVVAALYETFGAVAVPLETRMHLSVGTALAVMIPTTLTSYLAHRRRGGADEAIVRAWALPVVAGVALGAAVASVASQVVLKLVFAVLAAFNAYNMLSSRLSIRLAADTPSRPALAAAGLLIGLSSTLIGVGGGALGTLFLSLYGRPIHQNIGTSASLGVLIAVPGTIGYMLAGLPHAAELPFGSVGYVSLIGAAVVAPLAAVCAPAGVRVAHLFRPAQLRRAFGVFMLLLSLRFWASVLFGV